MLRRFEDITPSVDPSAWVDATALVIGDVVIGPQSSVWPMTVIRGDVGSVRIGARSNIQDGSVLHVTHESPYAPGRGLVVGDEVTVGHRVVLHACTVGDRVLVGMGSIIMDGAVVEPEVVIGAGTLVTPGKRLESGYLYVGSPVRRARPLNEQERAYLRYSAEHYVKVMDRHAGR